MGIFWSLFSVFFESAKDVVSKRLSFSVDGTLSAFASFAFALPFYLVLIFVLWVLGWEDLSLPTGFLLLLLLRSITDTAAEWMKMHAFAHGDISFISCFLGISPLFLLFISPIITGDAIPPAGWSGKRKGDLKLHGKKFLLRGLFEVSFMVAKLSALQYLQAPYVTGIQKLALVLSVLSGKVFFQEERIGRRLIGASIIVAGVLIICFL